MPSKKKKSKKNETLPPYEPRSLASSYSSPGLTFSPTQSRRLNKKYPRITRKSHKIRSPSYSYSKGLANRPSWDPSTVVSEDKFPRRKIHRPQPDDSDDDDFFYQIEQLPWTLSPNSKHMRPATASPARMGKGIKKGKRRKSSKRSPNKMKKDPLLKTLPDFRNSPDRSPYRKEHFLRAPQRARISQRPLSASPSSQRGAFLVESPSAYHMPSTLYDQPIFPIDAVYSAKKAREQEQVELRRAWEKANGGGGPRSHRRPQSALARSSSVSSSPKLSKQRRHHHQHHYRRRRRRRDSAGTQDSQQMQFLLADQPPSTLALGEHPTFSPQRRLAKENMRRMISPHRIPYGFHQNRRVARARGSPIGNDNVFLREQALEYARHELSQFDEGLMISYQPPNSDESEYEYEFHNSKDSDDKKDDAKIHYANSNNDKEKTGQKGSRHVSESQLYCEAAIGQPHQYIDGTCNECGELQADDGNRQTQQGEEEEEEEEAEEAEEAEEDRAKPLTDHDSLEADTKRTHRTKEEMKKATRQRILARRKEKERKEKAEKEQEEKQRKEQEEKEQEEKQRKEQEEKQRKEQEEKQRKEKEEKQRKEQEERQRKEKEEKQRKEKEEKQRKEKEERQRKEKEEKQRKEKEEKQRKEQEERQRKEKEEKQRKEKEEKQRKEKEEKQRKEKKEKEEKERERLAKEKKEKEEKQKEQSQKERQSAKEAENKKRFAFQDLSDSDDEEICQNCGGTGIDFFGPCEPCKIIARKKYLRDVERSKQNNQEATNTTTTSTRDSVENKIQVSINQRPADAPDCKKCLNSGQDLLGNPCLCIEQWSATCSKCGNTGINSVGAICNCKAGQSLNIRSSAAPRADHSNRTLSLPCDICTTAEAHVRCDSCAMNLCIANSCDEIVHRSKEKSKHIRIVRQQIPNASSETKPGNSLLLSLSSSSASEPCPVMIPEGQSLPVCFSCETCTATLYCFDCKQFICTEVGCDGDIHQKPSKRGHVRTPFVRVKSWTICPASVGAPHSVERNGTCTKCLEAVDCDVSSSSSSPSYSPAASTASSVSSSSCSSSASSSSSPSSSSSLSSSPSTPASISSITPSQPKPVVPITARITSDQQTIENQNTQDDISIQVPAYRPELCQVCDIDPPAIYCHDCISNGGTGAWYCTENECDSDIHQKPSKKKHRRTKL